MLLEQIAESSNVEAAAKAMAGNWKQWKNFVLFGADEIPNNHNICLGYLIGPAGSLNEMIDSMMVTLSLEQWIGEDKTTDLVVPYHADYCGDKSLLSGIMIRVYDDNGEITDPFKELFKVAQRKSDGDGVIDESFREKVNEEKCLELIRAEFQYLQSAYQYPFDEELVLRCYRELEEREEIEYDSLNPDDITDWMKDHVRNHELN